ncbi:glycosyl hydrolase [Proteiniphilum sp.]|uniref:glycosyl hydrolase n=1 Tax=Proteiniphilum sp. TaxID=1926877 RepID=UPI002B1FBE9F|nr:glycosyl hydrolase [Proteiniphilum sp.]MEA4918229.1 glycosyl hydrolase [Proteiniphilum sp.]
MAQHNPILLFPDGAPGESRKMEQEDDLSGNKVAGYPVLRVSNVSEPTLTFYPAPANNNTGATVIVNPGGGYNILAYNLEGTEICLRLNSFGVNCVLVKYRVPRREGLAKHEAPLQDLQRAIAYTRSHAREWNIDPRKIGVMGFSAGAHLSAMASTAYRERTYPKIDAYDDVSLRPDFCVLVYPAYLSGENFSISPELKVDSDTPPTILIQTQDDNSFIDSSLFYYYALKQAKVPVAMHLYPSGGHGYGLRNTGHAVNEWPDRVISWMKDMGFITLPSIPELYRPFGDDDREAFLTPAKIYYPETWFHYIGGNVSKEGITKDLEAIADAGISGIQLFHGQFGGPWPGVEPQITSLSPKWDDAVKHTAQECRRLGLRFVMQNCPGWATSGGPWIEPSNAMRHLAWSRTDVEGGTVAQYILPVPRPLPELYSASRTGNEEWLDYKDIMVLAFPTPLGDTGEPLIPIEVKSNAEIAAEDFFTGNAKGPVRFSPATQENPNWIEVTFSDPVMLRSVEFPSINSFNHHQCYEPGVNVRIEAVLPNGDVRDILQVEMPQANSQDNRPITLACSELPDVNRYRFSIVNKYPMSLSSLRLFSAARKNSWESEAGWTLRSIVRAGESPVQTTDAFVSSDQIIDISDSMDEQGYLNWKAPSGKWTILRIGHMNTGRRNSPAPPEGTGWECNKLSTSGADAQFAGYIGRLSAENGPLADGLLNGILLDSWECYTQTWTPDMEKEFEGQANYSLRKWLPAIFGYVIDDHETSKRFLLDWRRTINSLFTNNFYGRMAKLAHDNGLYITYETAAGDVFPADIMEYFKYADVPMCEFWQPLMDGFVGSNNFKPVKPAASAARLYGKPRLAAEAFTSFDLTWDEHLEMLKEVANINSVDGVTHLVFHTYTHNPQEPFLPPGTAFGTGIGTPFLRGQTWWKYMPFFTDYLARCSYLLERGQPVSDVLWYLGDELNHKPNQNAPFPKGFRYDYCNPDILLHRLSVRDGLLVTPEGISYKVLWLPDIARMLPETLERIYALVNDGAIVVGDAPQGPATLTDSQAAQKRFDAAIKSLWGERQTKGIRAVGKGSVVSGLALADALAALKITPDVVGGDALWLHRQIEGADWYFISAPKGRGFSGSLDFRSVGIVELWDPVTGNIVSVPGKRNGDRTSVEIELPKAGACFVVFRKDDVNSESVGREKGEMIAGYSLSDPWILRFPSGWGAPASLKLTDLKPWKELDISDEAKAFSGTVNYSTTFNIDKLHPGKRYILDLGRVDMIAVVSVNGKELQPLWASPYKVDITGFVKSGKNTIKIDVTSTWFNRLVYDAGQPEENRKTWTISGPGKDSPLRETGLLGPVKLQVWGEK